ncbi:MAG: hypothetical protein SCJ93_06060 [Bacillota bacterium]|nr:hypothetical protein [Bacillota bacterium]
MKYIDNKRGSSSILVILTFMMLVIFSVLVMMSSYSDYKLAQKNASYTKEYYELSGEANKFWTNIDSLISNISSNDLSVIVEELEKFDADTDIDIYENNLIISKTFRNNDSKELMIKLEYLENSRSFDLIALKEVPVEFEYEEIDFEDVEVYIE